jgi:hypothetical protein
MVRVDTGAGKAVFATSKEPTDDSVRDNVRLADEIGRLIPMVPRRRLEVFKKDFTALYEGCSWF